MLLMILNFTKAKPKDTLFHSQFQFFCSKMEAVIAAVTDAMLSAIIHSLFETLSSLDFLKFSRKKHIMAKIKKWKILLLKLNALLEDAEEKQITSRAVKLWLRDLQDVAFNAEDVVDALATEALRRKLMEHTQPSAGTSMVWKFILPTCFSVISPRTVKFSAEIESKIKEITTRLHDLAALKNNLNLMEIGGGRPEKVLQRLPTTSLVESHVYGREKDKDAILDMLMDGGEMGSGEVGVVPIVGMAGVGKTTLAQLVYNDVRIKASFELRAWVCVTEEFDVLKVTKTVLHAIPSGDLKALKDLEDLNLLQERLKDMLSGRKFLIILDDVWNENYEQWDILCRPFAAGAAGSKILVTTRNESVAAIMSSHGAYHLNVLSNDDCLALFTLHALGARNFNGHPNLKVVGEQIVRKCKGLPLVAKALGGLLRTKVNQDEWEDILMSKIWDLPEERSGILPALRLSYHHLPSYLKRCFAYCAIFPKDYEFDKDELVLLWMAEGYLKQPRGNIQMEHLGSEYFKELLSRSFFQRSNSNKTLFVMHDLINDLAQSVSGGMCYNFEDMDVLKGDNTDVEKIRHLSFTRQQYEFTKRLEVLYQVKNLRTLTALPTHMPPWAACCYLSGDVLQNLLSSFRCLRVLSLSYYCISELPNSIGHLKHLRYLNLSRSTIKQLPESVGSLFNLQTLILQGCTQLTKLPQGIKNLMNLRVLDLADTNNLQEMPFQIGNLKNLRILSKLIVGKGIGSAISELGGLLHLQGQLSFLGLEKVNDIQDASNANIRDKRGLTGLDLQWSHDHFSFQDKESQMDVLERLLPHENLKKLRILFYGGKIFPYWLSDPSLTKIVYLELCNCRNCTSLPSLGRLSSLKTLSITGMDSIQEVGLEFYGHSQDVKPFVSLETLQFKDMLKWTFWSSPSQTNEDSGEEFPCLKELMIENCPKLSGKLPSRLMSLVKLVIKHCPKLEGSSMSYPSLYEMNMEDFSEELLGSIVALSTPTTRITKTPELQHLQNGRVRFPGELKVLVISNCIGLTSLWQKEAILLNIASLECLKIKSCLKLASLAENVQGLSGNHEDLRLLKSSNLWKPPLRMQDFTSLEDLQIDSCPNLVSFPANSFPPILKNLELKDCQALKSLPSGIMMLNCLLEQLVIEDCPALTCFPRGRLPISLRRLRIHSCRDLISLPEGLMQTDDRTSKISHLENLEIIKCPSLFSFPEGNLPTSLKTLKIWDCYQLEPFSDRMLHENASLTSINIWNWTKMTSLPECLHSLNHLTELNVKMCPALAYFPETGLHLLNLRKFDIYNCINLKSLPDQMLRLTSLQFLVICECPGLQSFPKGGLPPNLLSLEIWDCKNLKQPISEWNLHTLTSLRELSIVGASDTIIFPDEKCLLPATLVSMFISRFHDLRSISMGLSNLTLLEDLEIDGCPKLQSLPVEGLPAKLGRLCIRDCQLLKQRCLRGIAHIPLLEIETMHD